MVYSCSIGKVLFRVKQGVAYLLYEILFYKETNERNLIRNAETLISETERLLKFIGVVTIKVVLSAKAELTDAIFNAPFYCGQQYYVDIKNETKIVLSKLL